MLSRIDITNTVKRATNAVEVDDSSKYPRKPEVNAVIFDRTLEALVIWDGSNWVTLATKPLASCPQ